MFEFEPTRSHDTLTIAFEIEYDFITVVLSIDIHARVKATRQFMQNVNFILVTSKIFVYQELSESKMSIPLRVFGHNHNYSSSTLRIYVCSYLCVFVYRSNAIHIQRFILILTLCAKKGGRVALLSISIECF